MPGRRTTYGFTLIELLVVIAIIAILAAILFPVFVRARENARKTACASNLKQLGLAILQYNQDYDENMPKGATATLAGNNATQGAGWAGNIMPYAKSTGLFKCPSEGNKPYLYYSWVSYGFNMNLAGGYKNGKLSSYAVPAQTVLLCEFQKSQAPIDRDNEGYDPAGANEQALSPSTSGYLTGSGCRNQLATCSFTIASGPFGQSYQSYALSVSGGGGTPGNNISPAYGRLGNFQGTGATTRYFYGADTTSPYDGAIGVHLEGSNFLMADGHVKWFKPDQVSPGFTGTAGQYQGQSNAGYSAASITNLKLSDGITPCAVTFSPI